MKSHDSTHRIATVDGSASRKNFSVRTMAIVACLFAVSGCSELEGQVCVDRLSQHLSALDGLGEPETPADAKRMVSQMASLTSTADLTGCSSQVRFGVQEMYTASIEAEKALSDENLLGTAVLSLIDAEEYSPMMQQLKQSMARFESACKVLNQEGVDC